MHVPSGVRRRDIGDVAKVRHRLSPDRHRHLPAPVGAMRQGRAPARQQGLVPRLSRRQRAIRKERPTDEAGVVANRAYVAWLPNVIDNGRPYGRLFWLGGKVIMRTVVAAGVVLTLVAAAAGLVFSHLPGARAPAPPVSAITQVAPFRLPSALVALAEKNRGEGMGIGSLAPPSGSGHLVQSPLERYLAGDKDRALIAALPALAQPTPSSAAAPPMVTPADVDKALAQLAQGHVVFNVPPTMRLGKQQTIQVALGSAASVSTLMAAITANGQKQTAALRVAALMAATLVGGDAFGVTPAGPQKQLVSERRVTSWTFRVTPKEAGRHHLILEMDAYIRLGGQSGQRRVNTLTRTIEVEVGWPQTISEWFDAGWKVADGAGKLVEGIGSLWSFVLVPAAGFVAFRWGRAGRHQAPGPPANEPTPSPQPQPGQHEPPDD